ncbi:MAG: TonB-dependent receptor plug domain-containing protein [Candidatus Pedobacter colombiensis]|uniref:TonB-dependent receptor plug domain-containing protein n=1 Tax=Candidatus Pedobacter colombiensis TaxID=3121371 RepID=A0AAJ5WBT2_9SPHI|nr:TonB-dependent receptor plug domain-containing protein [Pedobacter sp.]WEK21682.1 MAG: TonB-dependent receptor plug domain-containing protein [Pedobacter sp.]
MRGKLFIGIVLLLSGQNGLAQVVNKSEADTVHLREIIISNSDFRKQIMKVDLKMIPVNSAQDLLRKVPGLFIAQHAGGGKAEQIFLRGFDNDHGTDISVMADGIPVNIVSHAHGQGYADLHFLIPETIRDIDFGKGSYYADKGDFNTSGYVNFNTFDKLENNLFKIEGGSFNTIRAVTMINLLNKNSQDKNFYVASEFNYSDGPFDIKQHFNRINFLAKYNQWIDRKQYLSILGSTFTSGWNASGQIPERAVEQGIISRWGSIDPTEGGSTARTNFAVSYRYLASEKEEVSSNLFYSKYDFNLFSDFTFFLKDPVHGDEIQQTDNRSIYGFENKYIRRFVFENSSMTWTSGLGLRLDDIKDLQLSHVFQRDLLLDRMSDVSATEINVHGYSTIDWRVGKWTINPAVRLDHFVFNLHNRLVSIPAAQEASATRVSPKLNISYTQNSNVQWYVKSGFGFHSNDVRVVVAQDGKDILPYSFGSDLGVILRPTANIIIQPAIWQMFLQQEFVYVGDEAVVEPSGKTCRWGLDLSLRYQPFSWLYLDGDINYAHARAVEKPKGEDYIPLVPALTSTGGVAVKLLSGFLANLRYRYMDSKPATEDNSVRTRGYLVNDLVLVYGKKKWEVNLQVQNIFDRKWNEAQFETETRLRNETSSVSELCFTPGTPLAIKAGISYRF